MISSELLAIIAFLLTVLGVSIVVTVFKAVHKSTTEQLKNIGASIHEGVGKIDMLTEELKEKNNRLNINTSKDKP